MITGLSRRSLLLCLVIWGSAGAGDVTAADATAGHEHHAGMTGMAQDAHAAHRASMDAKSYSVTTEDYAAPDVRLIDADGQSIKLRELLDAEVPIALNFIFTTCTTICPVMTATFAQMQRQLGDSSNRVKLVSISIDPEYDRPDVLRAYAAQFRAGGNWSFLTGDSQDIVNVLRSFDVYAGSKMNHQPVTLLKNPRESSWTRIDGLASGEGLAREVTTRLLN